MLKVVIFDLVEGLQAAGATKTPFLRIKFNMHVKYWPFLPANRSKRRAQCPDIAGQHHVQHFPRVAYAASASGAAFEANDGLNGGDMAKAPKAESFFQVGQRFV